MPVQPWNTPQDLCSLLTDLATTEICEDKQAFSPTLERGYS